MSGADALMHQVKQAAGQQTQDYAPFVLGHIANYDPATNRVRLMLPSCRDENDTPVLTNWMPLGSAFAGNGIGLQVGPKGGATYENPTGGELCLIMRVDRQLGTAVAACMIFNQVNKPPFADLQAGEAGLMGPGGSFVRFHTDKHIEVHSEEKVVVTAVGDADITAQANANITASAIAKIEAPNIILKGAVEIDGAATGHAGGPIILNADIHQTGSITQTGTLATAGVASGGDVTAAGHSLTSHVHSDPQGGDTGPPIG